VFAESTRDEQGEYPTVHFGIVVDKDVETDSLIFEVLYPFVKDRVDLMKISTNAGLDDGTIQLPQPNENPTPQQQELRS